MKFVYSFQKVLDVKTNEKKQAESSLSQAIGIMAELEKELSGLVRTKQQTQLRLSEQSTEKRTMADMLSVQQYVEFLEGQIQLMKRKLLESERSVNELRERLTERTMDEKVWLNAREKAHGMYMTEVQRRMQNELDEMATMRSRVAR